MTEAEAKALKERLDKAADAWKKSRGANEPQAKQIKLKRELEKLRKEAIKDKVSGADRRHVPRTSAASKPPRAAAETEKLYEKSRRVMHGATEKGNARLKELDEVIKKETSKVKNVPDSRNKFRGRRNLETRQTKRGAQAESRARQTGRLYSDRRKFGRGPNNIDFDKNISLDKARAEGRIRPRPPGHKNFQKDQWDAATEAQKTPARRSSVADRRHLNTRPGRGRFENSMQNIGNKNREIAKRVSGRRWSDPMSEGDVKGVNKQIYKEKLKVKQPNAQRVSDLERQIKNAAKPSAANARQIETARRNAQAAIKSGSAFSKARGALNASVEGLFTKGAKALLSNPIGRAAGKAVSAIGRTGAGRVLGAVASKTAAPLMIAQGAYDAGRTIQEGYKAVKAGQEAKSNAEYMQKNYGSVEAATATRRRKQRKKSNSDQLKQGYLLK